jgi:hypothetical protein
LKCESTISIISLFGLGYVKGKRELLAILHSINQETLAYMLLILESPSYTHSEKLKQDPF